MVTSRIWFTAAQKALQDLGHEERCLPKDVGAIGAVRHQAAGWS